MEGYLSLVLHAHLPFVRHPEHESFLEENWLFEAITETYIPLLMTLAGWRRDGLQAPLTITLTPTLCAMLQDSLLRERYRRYLDGLLELAEKELHRTVWEKALNELAVFYHQRFDATRDFYRACNGDLLAEFRRAQDEGQLEIITSAATHALLPLLANHPPSLRAQVLVARDDYRHCFGRDPRGIWLPECGYAEGVGQALNEANLRWFILDTHGVLKAQPRPRFGLFAPILTPQGAAAFGRDMASARQVWSRHEGYPGDPAYRDFYRDIGFDLDLEYLGPHLASHPHRGFTGIKYHRITGGGPGKAVYDRSAALHRADEHAGHFLAARMEQIQRLASILGRPPIIVAPYDAELFGHWWYEGPEFMDRFVRQACGGQTQFKFITPSEYLRRHPTHQVATPAASSWGEGGYWRVWLNEKTEWIYPHLQVAQERMTDLARRYSARGTTPTSAMEHLASASLEQRALRQAARELLLAQASDWPFILRADTSAGYARRRIKEHLSRFAQIHRQLSESNVDEAWLREIESRDNLFPNVNWQYWA